MPFMISGELLEACVLAAIQKKDSYGYELTQHLNEIITVSESTLYPVLRRLTKDKLLETYDRAYEGRNRRYYTITLEGEKQIEIYRADWDTYKSNLDILLGDDGDE